MTLNIQDSFPLLTNLFNEIKEKTANHDQFAENCTKGGNFVAEISNFSKLLFNIYKEVSMLDSLPALKTISSELNIRIHIYTTKGIRKKIKKNRFIDPLVVSVFLLDDNINKFFALYHEDYKVIDEANHNTSLMFDYKEPDINHIWIIEEIIRVFAESLDVKAVESFEIETIKKNLEEVRQGLDKVWNFQNPLEKKFLDFESIKK